LSKDSRTPRLNSGALDRRLSFVPRKLSAEKQLELESLYRVAAIIAAFIDARIPNLPSGGFTAAMREALEERDLRGLRLAYNDLVASTEAASGAEKRELDQRLQAEAGVSIASLLKRRYQRVGRFRSRGKLTSEEQYYLVREYVEFAGHDPANAVEVEELTAMMAAYEDRVAERAKKRSTRARPSEEL
jgi:hypothetical protein